MLDIRKMVETDVTGRPEAWYVPDNHQFPTVELSFITRDTSLAGQTGMTGQNISYAMSRY